MFLAPLEDLSRVVGRDFDGMIPCSMCNDSSIIPGSSEC